MHRISPIRSTLVLVTLLAISAAAFAQFSVSISFAPPELPVYEQAPCPGDGYIWTPGYWAFSDDDYYWVPGTWVEPPSIGLLWTPAYWAWDNGQYQFHDGYWGTSVGFYGGIDYGYGYGGEGYEGGRWQGGHFLYNQSVNNVNTSITRNVYSAPVKSSGGTRVSFNGGNGGVNARPTAQDQAASRERHIPPVAAQTQHVQAARAKPELRASQNHGKPPVAATPKPGALNDRAVVRAKQSGPTYTPPANRAATHPTQPKGNTPATRPESGGARSSTTSPTNRQEANRAPESHSNNQPTRSRNEVAPKQEQAKQPPATSAQSSAKQHEAAQPQRTSPGAIARPAEKPEKQARPAEKPQKQSKPQEKQGEQSKHEER